MPIRGLVRIRSAHRTTRRSADPSTAEWSSPRTRRVIGQRDLVVFESVKLFRSVPCRTLLPARTGSRVRMTYRRHFKTTVQLPGSRSIDSRTSAGCAPSLYRWGHISIDAGGPVYGWLGPVTHQWRVKTALGRLAKFWYQDITRSGTVIGKYDMSFVIRILFGHSSVRRWVRQMQVLTPFSCSSRDSSKVAASMTRTASDHGYQDCVGKKTCSFDNMGLKR
nr:hypothetical protein CFP56_54945 [Quercus suber]